MKFNVEFPGGWLEEVDTVLVADKIAEYLYDNGKMGVTIEDDGNGYIVYFPDSDSLYLDYGQMASLIITMKALTTASKGSLVRANLVQQDKPIKVKF